MLKLLTLALLVTLSFSVVIPSTYADTADCQSTITAVTGSIVEKGVNVFGKSPDITTFHGTVIPVLLKFLHAHELEASDQITFFTEPQAAVGFVLFGKEGCSIAVGTLPTIDIEKTIAFVANARMVNAP